MLADCRGTLYFIPLPPFAPFVCDGVCIVCTYGRLCLQCFEKYRVSGQQGQDPRGQSFLPANWLVDVKVSEPPMPPRGVPYLATQVLRSLLPVTCCSGGEEARPCPPKRMHWLSLGGSGLIPRCSSGQHGNTKLLMLCKVVGCLGQSRDPLLTMTQKCITSLQRTEFATEFCLRSGTTLW